MNPVAQIRSSSMPSVASYALPAMLALNTFALLALDGLGQIPTWLKSAVALYLSF